MPKSPSSNKSSNKCCSSNSVSSLLSHLALLPPVLVEKSPHLFGRRLNRLSRFSLSPRLLHRLFSLSLASSSSWYLGICSSIPGSVSVYFLPSTTTTLLLSFCVYPGLGLSQDYVTISFCSLQPLLSASQYDLGYCGNILDLNLFNSEANPSGIPIVLKHRRKKYCT
jgi:hypothetical protein